MPTGLKINCDDPSNASIVLLCAPYDRTASYRKGAVQGPAAITEALLHQMETYDRYADTLPSPSRSVALTTIELLNLATPEAMVARVKHSYETILDTGAFVFLLGGEHSVSTGALQAIASRRDAHDITVCQIDAHLDLRHDDSDYSSAPHGIYAHCTVMRRAFELGFPCVNVGARAYSLDERDFARSNRIPVFEWGAPVTHRIGDILLSIPTDTVYITIDADGLDPAHMPATGTPVPGGLEWYYTVELLRELYKHKRIIGADIVEVSPRPDDVLTEYGAAQLCYTMLALGEKYGHITDRQAAAGNCSI